MIDFLDMVLCKSEVQIWRFLFYFELITLHGSYINIYARWKVNFRWLACCNVYRSRNNKHET